jgi:hypothetical protein
MTRSPRTRSFSARFAAEVVEKLEVHSRRLGESKARLAERLIEEGLRVQEFPGILFRSGPAGRRAGVAGGPDMWEIVRDVKAAAAAGVSQPLDAVASATGLDRSKVELAASYYAAYPEDIDERIRMEEEAAERLRRALGIEPAA